MRDAILITGAAGFIGSALVRRLRRSLPTRPLVSFDALTYAGGLDNLAPFEDDPRHHFVHADVTDANAVRAALERFDPTVVMHLAAESHVDRSIGAPLGVVQTNVQGTATLLDAVRHHWGARRDTRFVMVSTDEVFGQLGATGRFDEGSPLRPRSPYSASKAAADLLAGAWHSTYGLPTLITRCGNNYGPRQHPEKLVPLMITRAIAGEPLPVYGTGENVRDWIHVDDHADALIAVMQRGRPGESYCIGADREQSNLALVERIADLVDEALGRPAGTARACIRFVDDRPGHDQRYAIDSARARVTLDWRPRVDFEAGLSDTVRWYLENSAWCARRRRPADAS